MTSVSITGSYNDSNLIFSSNSATITDANTVASALANSGASTAQFGEGVRGWKLHVDDFVATVAQVGVRFPNPWIASDTLVYGIPGLYADASNPQGDHYDPGVMQKFLGMHNNTAYWSGNGFHFADASYTDGLPVAYANNPTGKVIYGHVEFFNFDSLKFNFYAFDSPSKFFTINSPEDVVNAIANGELDPWMEPAMRNMQTILQTYYGMDLIGDPFSFTYESLTSLSDVQAAQLELLGLS